MDYSCLHVDVLCAQTLVFDSESYDCVYWVCSNHLGSRTSLL